MTAIGPGLHDFSHAFYASDPCIEPSLDARGIKLLLDASPAHLAAQHIRLTQWPDQLRVKQRDESLGAIVRCLVLNQGHEIAATQFDDWTTKQAQIKRAQARADGQIPATRHVLEQAAEIARSGIRALAVNRSNAKTLTDATLVWRRHVEGSSSIWCRERADQLSGYDHHAVTLVQTVTRAANDRDIAKAIENSGLDIRAAWLLSGLVELFPKVPHIATIVTIETEPPYLAVAKRLDEDWLDDCRRRVDAAVRVYAAASRTDQWTCVPTPTPLRQPTRRIV